MNIKSVALFLCVLVLAACASNPAGKVELNNETITGVWLRPIEAGSNRGLEGFELLSDGTIKMVGIYSRSGISWRLNRNQLKVVVKPKGQQQALEKVYGAQLLDRDSLRLTAPGSYFTGNYKRFVSGQYGLSSVKVTGTIEGHESIGLPKNGEVYLELADVTPGKKKADIVATNTIDRVPSGKIPFEIYFDPSQVKQDHTYTVRARIINGRKTLMMNYRLAPVLTRGAGHEVRIKLRKI